MLEPLIITHVIPEFKSPVAYIRSRACWVSTCTYIYMYLHIHVCICIHVHVCVYTQVYVLIHVYRLCIYVFINIQVIEYVSECEWKNPQTLPAVLQGLLGDIIMHYVSRSFMSFQSCVFYDESVCFTYAYSE
jgi:hypothetical protein